MDGPGLGWANLTPCRKDILSLLPQGGLSHKKRDAAAERGQLTLGAQSRRELALKDRVDDFTMDVCQSEVAASVAISELFMIEA